MKYIFKNLYSLKKNQTIFLLLIAISVLATSIMINFSFGIYYYYRERKLSEIDELRHIQIEVTENAILTKSMLENCFLHFSEDLESLINIIFVSAAVNDGLKIECRFARGDGMYLPSVVFRDNLLKANLINNYFSEEQEANGELVALCPKSMFNHVNSLKIQGKTYKIIGYQDWNSDIPIIPFSSLEPETKIYAEGGIYLSFSKAIMKHQYDEISKIFYNNLGDIIQVPQLPVSYDQDWSLYNTIMLIAVCIAVIAAINFAILFQYIMLQREKMLAVYRICGMRKYQAVLTYLSECILIIVPIYITGTLTYHFTVLPILAKSIDSIRAAYSLRVYILLFLTYISSSIIILFPIIAASVCKKKIVDSI